MSNIQNVCCPSCQKKYVLDPIADKVFTCICGQTGSWKVTHSTSGLVGCAYWCWIEGEKDPQAAKPFLLISSVESEVTHTLGCCMCGKSYEISGSLDAVLGQEERSLVLEAYQNGWRYQTDDSGVSGAMCPDCLQSKEETNGFEC